MNAQTKESKVFVVTEYISDILEALVERQDAEYVIQKGNRQIRVSARLLDENKVSGDKLIDRVISLRFHSTDVPDYWVRLATDSSRTRFETPGRVGNATIQGKDLKTHIEALDQRKRATKLVVCEFFRNS